MTNKEERFVDLSNIPKTKKGGINWKESVGKDIYFKYGNLTGYIHIIGENGDDKYNINAKVNGIGRVCRGEQKSHKGFHFEYVEVDE